MLKRSVFALSLFALTSCAYISEDSVQMVTFETPGAHNALCFVHIDNVKYKLRPPQKLAVKKDDDPMVVDCKAPGNRHKKIEVKPRIEEDTYWNMFNGVVPGTSWDYLSDSMFRYPDVVYIDFRSERIKPNKLPDHNAPDIKQPEDYDLEEFLPARPRMNADKYEKPIEIKRREMYDGGSFADEAGLGDSDYDPSATKGKGDLMSIESEPLPAATEGESSAAQKEGVPTPLFPLE